MFLTLHRDIFRHRININFEVPFVGSMIHQLYFRYKILFRQPCCSLSLLELIDSLEAICVWLLVLYLDHVYSTTFSNMESKPSSPLKRFKYLERCWTKTKREKARLQENVLLCTSLILLRTSKNVEVDEA